MGILDILKKNRFSKCTIPLMQPPVPTSGEPPAVLHNMLQYMYLYYLQLYYCTSTSPRAAAFSLLHFLHTCLANAKFATEKKETEKAQCQVGKLALPTDKYAQGAGDGRGGSIRLKGENTGEDW